jgi:hypothetical protein
MRFHLALTSLIIIIISSCAITEDWSEKDLLQSFKASDEYVKYLKERPITSQVIVIIEIAEIGKEYSFPNPYVAQLFVNFVDAEANLKATRQINQSTYKAQPPN